MRLKKIKSKQGLNACLLFKKYSESFLMVKSALITGVNGQDGSYLASFAKKRLYYLWGCKRRSECKKF